MPCAARQIEDIAYPCTPDGPSTCNLDSLFERLRVCGLMVLKWGEVVLERYHRDNELCAEREKDDLPPHGPQRMYQLASVAKSITSTLVGFALADASRRADGTIDPGLLEQPVDRYLVELASDRLRGGYAGVSIDHILPPAALCCLGASLPDLARFGQFVLTGGKDHAGQQLLPAGWFDLATRRRPGVDDAVPSGNPSFNEGCPLDYRCQWWGFPEPRDDFTAVGIDGQFIHILPAAGVVIVQVSDWGKWEDGDRRECESFRAHNAIVAALQP